MSDSNPPTAVSPKKPEPQEVVQLEAFEGSKENIQPSRTGYNPHKLLHSLTPHSSPATATTLLATQRHTLEQAILDYTGTDPLLPWLRYVDWVTAAYPSLAPCSSLLPLLEKATRTFLSSAQYTNDRRYVRLWLLYADRCPQPADIFAFMQAHAIGRTVAAFYVAWARWCELVGRWRQAEEVLAMGVVCGAVPRNTVEIAMKQLKARNEVRVRREVEAMAAQQLDPLSDVVLNAMSDTQPRRVLSQLQQHDKENVALQQQQQPAAAQSVSSYRRPISVTPHVAIRPVSTTQTPIQIYTDATTPTTNTHSLPHLTPTITPPTTAATNWRTLPTRAAANKENNPAPTTWNQPLHTTTTATHTTTHTTHSTASQPPQPRFVVWRDEECERAERAEVERAEEVVERERVRREKAAGMRRRMEAGHAAQATPHSKLTIDPLRNINKLAAANAPQTAQLAEAAAATADVKPAPASAPAPRVRDNRPALSGLTVSLNATARPVAPAVGNSALYARLQAHRSMIAPRR